MSRTTVFLFLTGLLVTFGCLGGCASPGANTPVGWLASRFNFSKPKADEAQAEKAMPPEKNPLRSRADAIAAREREARAGSADEPGKSATKTSTHDQQLLAMIEQELQHEPRSERQQLYQEWKDLDPALVRQLIRLRRANREVAANVAERETVRQSAVSSRQSAVGSQQQPHSTLNPQLSTLNPPPQQYPGVGTDPWKTPYGTSPYSPSYYQGRGGRPDSRQVYYQSGFSQPPVGAIPAGYMGHSADYGQSGSYHQPPPGYQSQQGLTPAQGYSHQSSPAQAPQYVPYQQQPPLYNNAGYQNRMPTQHSAAGMNNDQYQKSAPAPASPPLPSRTSGFGTSSVSVSQAQPVPGDRLAGPSSAMEVDSNTQYSDTGWEQTLDQLIARAQDSVARLRLGTTPEENKLYVERHVHLRMLYLMDGREQRALEPIPGINSADQEFWQQVFWGLSNYFAYDAMPDASERATQTIEQLRMAIRKLQAEARLELRNVVFCRNIASFGNYTQFERDEFSPGEPVLLYAEVANFKSEPTAENHYRTILRSTVQILTPDGRVVEEMVFPATQDLCRNYRRDYFHSYEFSIPESATLGPHVLKLTVEDELNNKVATYQRNFTVR